MYDKIEELLRQGNRHAIQELLLMQFLERRTES